jgi:hypothetical protein
LEFLNADFGSRIRKPAPASPDALPSIRDPKSALRNFSLAGLLYRAGCRIVLVEIESKTWGR